MSSCTRLPTLTPTRPWFQPGMTWAKPIWLTVNVALFFHDASKTLPSA